MFIATNIGPIWASITFRPPDDPSSEAEDSAEFAIFVIAEASEDDYLSAQR